MPPEREAAPTGPGTATNVEPRDVYQDTSSRPAPIRIAAIRPKVAKVADSRKVDSRRIVGKSPESRKSLQSRQKVVESRSIVVNSRTIVAKKSKERERPKVGTPSLFIFPL